MDKQEIRERIAALSPSEMAHVLGWLSEHEDIREELAQAIGSARALSAELAARVAARAASR